MECTNKYLLTLYDNDELDIKRRYQMVMGLPRIQGNINLNIFIISMIIIDYL